MFQSTPDFIVNSTTIGSQWVPSVAALPEGGFVAVWESQDAGDGSGSCIRARLFGADGSPAGDDFIANSTTQNSQIDPGVAALPDGHFLVVWESADPGDGSGLCIRARLFDADGDAVGNDFIVNSTTVGDQRDPDVAALTDGRFVVTWASNLEDRHPRFDVQHFLRARFLDGTGTALAADFIAAFTLDNDWFVANPNVAALPNGGFAIGWEDESFDTQGRGSLFGMNGAPVGGLGLGFGDATESPAPAALPDGRVVFAWHDRSDFGSPAGITMSLFDSHGARISTPTLVDPGFPSRFPSVTTLPDGRFVVMWSGPGDGSGSSILAQLFNTHGVAAGERVVVNTTLLGDQAFPDATALSDGRLFVAWQSLDGGDGSGSTIRATTLALIESTFNDFAGDGRSDIFWRDDNGALVLWEMNGPNVITNQSITPIGAVPDYWRILDIADFNGDGRNDVLWEDDTGVVVVWEMDGSTIVGNTAVTGTADFGALPDHWHFAGTGDFNGDDNSDILWRDDAGAIVLWEMDGPAIVRNTVIGNLAADWQPAEIGDFNGDVQSDILWRNDDGTVRLWEMNGATVLADTTINALPSYWQIADSGDYNSDSRTDLLWRDELGTLVMWEMDGPHVSENSSLGTFPTGWEIVNSGDYNGDGSSDILWRIDDGTVRLWEMNGPAILADTNVGTVPTWWHIV